MNTSEAQPIYIDTLCASSAVPRQTLDEPGRSAVQREAQRDWSEKLMPLFQRKERQRSALLPAVRLYPEELASVQNAALQADQTVTDYIRARLFADAAPIQRQSASNPAPESSESSLPVLLLPSAPLPSPENQSSLRKTLAKNKEKKMAGRANETEEKSASGICAHGFKRIGKLTVCGECKKARA